MKSFNVIWWDFNKKSPEPYNIIPYLIRCYNKINRNKPKTLEELKKFIKNESMYQWWGRCEYEIIIHRWPPKEGEYKKIDIHEQIMMNIDIIAEILYSILHG